jgi:tetratricopeptide (TPR) repeat protein/peptidoglycan/xylan/chitin deacetylase (PgdA/CDA1 family)
MTEQPVNSRGPDQKQWARPKPVQRDSQFRAWMLFLAGLFAAVALWAPLRAIYERTRFTPLVEGVRDADSFVALAYGGVSSGRVRGPEEVSGQQFADHISVLRERGYNPIGLKDVQAFYRNGTLLPRKAVLVTLEQSKRSSYLEAKPVLRRFRWKAGMFVRADTIEKGDSDVLRWPILREMLLSGTWDLGAESIRGFEKIPVGADGKEMNFFASPRWLPEAKRLETLEEYRTRINDEHEAMVKLFERGTGERPPAFAFPYGDYGQYDPRAVVSRVLNLEAVKQHYGIGFTLGPFMLNTRYSDPRALNRLLVDPQWSKEEFIGIIESAQAVMPGKVVDALSPGRWRAVWGGINSLTNGALHLHANNGDGGAEKTTGALMWMVGSDLFRDFTMSMRFRRIAGHLSIRLRSRLGGEASVRLICGADGVWRLVHKVYGSPEHIQAEARDIQADCGTERNLQITILGRQANIMLDGRMLFGELIDLDEDPQPGMIGIEIWDPEPGIAAVDIINLDFPRQRQVMLEWNAAISRNPAPMLSMLHGSAYRLAALSPPWLDIVRSVPLAMPAWDSDSVKTFGAIHGIPVLPRMMVRSAELAGKIPHDMPADAAMEMDVDGIYINCNEVDIKDMTPLVEWLQLVHQNMKEKNMGLAISFPPAMVRMASFASVAALFSGAVISVNSADAAAAVSGSISNVVVSETVENVSESDLHLDLFYQLGAKAIAGELDDTRGRIEVLWQDGLEAYQAGEYNSAIKHWADWLAIDPRNTEALKLLARVYRRVGDKDKALDAYTKCLEVTPGEISTVIQRAELLDELKRPDEAREFLNLYARVFPGNADILIAQAEWLNRRKRRLEARAILETLTKEQPDNAAARIALLNMQDNSAERFDTMRSLLAMGEDRNSQVPFSQVLLSRELLTYEESSVFFDFVRRLAFQSEGERQRRLYSQFLPLDHAVTDDFVGGRLSDGWITSGGIRTLQSGRYELRAALDQAESYLRLRQSELLRDAVLDVTLDESQGFFWLYGRRSSHAMVRFGFDEDGYIYLQAWNKGDLVSHKRRPWGRPPGQMTIRMEIRGDGVRGFVNGAEIFDTPLPIPREVAYGWWGIAPFSFELGQARARILKMTCAPNPATVVLTAPDDANNVIRVLRPFSGRISALSPAWFRQEADGEVRNTVPADADVLRMYCAFNRIRLIPVVDLAYRADIDPATLVDLVHTNNLAGLLIKRRAAPGPEWEARLQKEIEKRPASVLIMETEAALWRTPPPAGSGKGGSVMNPQAEGPLLPLESEKLRLTEVPAGNVLLSPLHAEWLLELSVPDATGEAPHSAVPELYLLDSGRWLSSKKD